MNTILITGASTGIGKSIVELAATQKDTTIIVFTLHKLTYKVPKNVEIHTINLTHHDDVTKLVKKVQKKHPKIDVLINNAGNGWRGMIEDTTLDEAKQQLETNVWALMHLTRLILPSMRAHKAGHVINISSVSATINYATIGYYSATKAFIEKISEVLALELEPWNIKVSLVAPGAVKTKFGHNMMNIKQYGKGDYQDSYRIWAERFETMFQKPLSSKAAAEKILKRINNPKPYFFLTKRDALYCYLKKIIPRRLFNTLFLRRYMNL